MKILDSKIFDTVNLLLLYIQKKLFFIKESSFIISNIDKIILFSIIITFILSTFVSNNVIACIAIFVPLLVFLKVLITENEKIELEKCNFFLLIYLLICLITNFTSSMPYQSFYGFMKTLLYFAFYFALCQFFKNNKKYIVPIVFVIASIMTIESFIGVFQSIIKVESMATWQDLRYVNPEDVISRVYGTLKPYNPNLFGGYLIAGLTSVIAIFSLFLNEKKIKSSIISALCVLVCMFCIFMTGCRGAYIALFIILLGIAAASYHIVFNYLKNEKFKRLWKIFISFCTFLGVSFLLLNQSFLKRLLSIFLLRGDSSTSFRLNVYQSAIQMFQDNPICGIGVGNKVFREIYGLYMYSGFDALSCYSVFLEMAVESGIFALIAYLLFISVLLINGIKIFIFSGDIHTKILIFMSVIAILAVMVHGIFDTVYFRPQIQFIFWTMAAILVTMTRKEKIKE